MRSMFLGLIAAILAPTLAIAACDPGEERIRFSHVTAAQGHPKGEAALLLEQRINRELNGRACMEVFARSTLFNDDDVLPAMLRGEVEMAAPSLSKFEAYTRKFRVFDLPFMFEDVFAVEEFQYSPEGEALKRSMEAQGLIGLEFWHNGMKQISATRPLISPTDAAGMKFRIQPSPVLNAQMEALGSAGVAMPFSAVYEALKNGEVQGQENTWSNIYTQSFHTVQDGVTETNHGIIDYLVVTSADWWNGLEPGLHADLAQILLEVTHERNRFAFEIGEMNRSRIMADGGVIRELTPEQRAEWVAAFAPVWDQFRGDIGDDLIAAAERAQGGF
ncbi:C4-dicarboxylate-binding protein DctP [Rubricella aquisinus]|uniref:C4-dicarboxylate-binding protein DctP n=1 Tax=Rubricella aquisinus TaxID=2028108 RepID=A0A840X188_9RHOB|nr:DctP family TRAP transporter solute-binding subunit [Rubricella aquisinus]MBB5514417.1 C4-dicarboxylate-binding protein DctP [Rubricella aquisinus]